MEWEGPNFQRLRHWLVVGQVTRREGRAVEERGGCRCTADGNLSTEVSRGSEEPCSSAECVADYGITDLRHLIPPTLNVLLR